MANTINKYPTRMHIHYASKYTSNGICGKLSKNPIYPRQKNKALIFKGISYTNLARQTARPEDLS